MIHLFTLVFVLESRRLMGLKPSFGHRWEASGAFLSNKEN
jgi:hypothetical protein